MKTAKPFQFYARLALGGAILAQQAPFLPVASAGAGGPGDTHLPEMPDLLSFLPSFDFSPKNLPVARPLLKDQLQ